MTNYNGEVSVAGMSSPLSILSNRPALRNKWVLTGQCAFFGKSEIKLRPAAQYSSPPRESTTLTNKFRGETAENVGRVTHPRPEDPWYYFGTCVRSWILPAGTDQRNRWGGANSTGPRPELRETNTVRMEMRTSPQKGR